LPGALFTLFAGSVLGTIGGVAMWAGGEQSPPPDETLLPIAEIIGSTAAAEDTPRFLQTEVPFGPFLALAAGTFALFQPLLAEWYFR